MPFRSKAQERFFHSKGAKKAGISPDQVNEFDQASKGLQLPETAPEPEIPSIGNSSLKPKRKKLVF